MSSQESLQTIDFDASRLYDLERVRVRAAERLVWRLRSVIVLACEDDSVSWMVVGEDRVRSGALCANA